MTSSRQGGFTVLEMVIVMVILMPVLFATLAATDTTARTLSAGDRLAETSGRVLRPG